MSAPAGNRLVSRRARGPWDIGERKPESEDGIDFGGLIVFPPQGAETQLVGGTVVISYRDATLALRAIAAPKSGGQLPKLYREIEKRETVLRCLRGVLGPELWCRAQVGSQQASVILLVEGPRWVLIAQLTDRAILEVGPGSVGAEMRATVRRTIVRRGPDAMAPGDPLPLSQL